MKKLFLLLTFVSVSVFAQTKIPVQFLNPVGSTAGQVPTSTGPTTPPAWANAGSAAQYIATLGITGALNQGAFAYGTLSYTDTNLFSSYQCNVNGYCQSVWQNTMSGATASTDIVVSNNLGTATTYFANFGINSSAFSGTGSFNLPNASYMTATSGDLAIGTTTANAIHFVVNSGATDAATISSTGAVTISPASAAVTISPTGTGTVTINPAAASSINNATVGITTPLAGKFTTLAATGLISPTYPSGIAGNATGSAVAAGSVGEFVTATGSAVSLSSGVGTNITSVSLTAGDWDLTASVYFAPAGTTTTSLVQGGISSVSATLPAGPLYTYMPYALSAGQPVIFAVPSQRFLIGTTTTYYCVATASFAVSTETATCTINARRR